MLFKSSLLALIALLDFASAATLTTCDANNCLRQVRATAFTTRPTAADCSSYLVTTSTVTANGGAVDKRQDLDAVAMAKRATTKTIQRITSSVTTTTVTTSSPQQTFALMINGGPFGDEYLGPKAGFTTTTFLTNVKSAAQAQGFTSSAAGLVTFAGASSPGYIFSYDPSGGRTSSNAFGDSVNEYDDLHCQIGAQNVFTCLYNGDTGVFAICDSLDDNRLTIVQDGNSRSNVNCQFPTTVILQAVPYTGV